MNELQKYVPDDFSDEFLVEVDDSLAVVVARINAYLPPSMIWKLFASEPEATGGVVKFPYRRVDTSVIVARDADVTDLDASSREFYDLSCMCALAAVLWVEV